MTVEDLQQAEATGEYLVGLLTQAEQALEQAIAWAQNDGQHPQHIPEALRLVQTNLHDIQDHLASIQGEIRNAQHEMHQQQPEQEQSESESSEIPANPY